jgi:hypothetical protein
VSNARDLCGHHALYLFVVENPIVSSPALAQGNTARMHVTDVVSQCDLSGRGRGVVVHAAISIPFSARDFFLYSVPQSAHRALFAPT